MFKKKRVGTIFAFDVVCMGSLVINKVNKQAQGIFNFTIEVITELGIKISQYIYQQV